MLPPSDVMDPLSDVLALLKPRSHMAGGFDVGNPWSIRFDRHEGVKCHAVVAGACWLFSVAFKRAIGYAPRRYALGEEKRVAPSAEAA